MVTKREKAAMRTTIRKIENLLTKQYEGTHVAETDYYTLLRYWDYEREKIMRLIELEEKVMSTPPGETVKGFSVGEWWKLTRRKDKENRFNPS